MDPKNMFYLIEPSVKCLKIFYIFKQMNDRRSFLPILLDYVRQNPRVLNVTFSDPKLGVRLWPNGVLEPFIEFKRFEV